MGAIQELTGVNRGCQILDIGWGLSELVDIKGGSRNGVEGSGGWQILMGVKGYWILGGGCWN